MWCMHSTVYGMPLDSWILSTEWLPRSQKPVCARINIAGAWLIHTRSCAHQQRSRTQSELVKYSQLAAAPRSGVWSLDLPDLIPKLDAVRKFWLWLTFTVGLRCIDAGEQDEQSSRLRSRHNSLRHSTAPATPFAIST